MPPEQPGMEAVPDLPRVVVKSSESASLISQIEPSLIERHGAVLFRGFGVDSTEAFREAVAPLLGDFESYAGGVGFKSRLSSGVYTSTDLPGGISISPHSELSYTQTPPRFVAFWCEQPAERGGQTSLVCARRVFEGLSAPVREAFEERGVCYLRAYPPDGSLVRLVNRWAPLWPTWEQVFETADPAEVEHICDRLGLTFHWSDKGELCARITLPGVDRNVTGRRVWLNHAHTFAPSPAAVGWLGYALFRLLGFLPPFRQATATFGDGVRIPPSMLQEISLLLRAESRLVEWEPNDLLVIYNQAVLHGRMPYSGPRRVWAVMGRGRVA